MFTITAVGPEPMWASEAGIPFGRLRGEDRYEPLSDGRIGVCKLASRGIRIAADIDEEIFGPGCDPLRETLQRIAAKARAAS
jgi:hypothetical protein